MAAPKPIKIRAAKLQNKLNQLTQTAESSAHYLDLLPHAPQQ